MIQSIWLWPLLDISYGELDETQFGGVLHESARIILFSPVSCLCHIIHTVLARRKEASDLVYFARLSLLLVYMLLGMKEPHGVKLA